MSKATVEEVESLLKGVHNDIEEVEAKLQTAIRFLEILKYQENELVTIVEEELDSDDREIIRELRALGYLEE